MIVYDWKQIRYKNDFLVSEIVIQCRKRNPDGETLNDWDFFQKPWIDYKSGFGEIGSDFWIGLETIHELTSGPETWKLQVRIF